MTDSEAHTSWMYDNDRKIDTEQYLLGRKIDDAIDPTKVEDKHSEWLAGGIPDPGDLESRAAMWKTRDAFAKAREDPMFVIEKQRRQAHHTLKNNPLKMQKIREFLVSELQKDVKKKKKKKHKKRMELDEVELDEKSKVSLPDQQSKSTRRQSKSPRRQSKSPKRQSKSPRRQFRSPKRRSRSPRKRSGLPKRRSMSPRKRSRSPRKRSRSPSRRSRSPKRVSKLSKQRSPKGRSDKLAQSRDPSFPSRGPKHPSAHRGRDRGGISKKLTAEELQARRQAMMRDADQRAEHRRNKYVVDKSAEEADTVRNEEGKADFVREFKVATYSASNSTVEGRIKSNIFSKQRTKADLQTFLKR